MTSQVQLAGSHPPSGWQMPIVPQSYDRRPLTDVNARVLLGLPTFW